MIAARFHRFGGSVRIEQVPDPEPEHDEVVVNVSACQIGADILKVLAGTGPVRDADRFIFPHTPGYRGAGVVESVGASVDSVVPGDRVVINGFLNCRQCEYCRRGQDNLCERSAMLGVDSGMPGAMAERVKAPAHAVFALPKNVSFERSTLLSNLALLVHAYGRAELDRHFTTAVYGCGLVGSGAIAVAKALGATEIIAVDTRPVALWTAEACGATRLIHAGEEDPVKATLDATNGQGADVVVEIVGIGATIRDAVRSTRRRGVTLLIGALKETMISFPRYYSEVIQREVDMRACFGKTQRDFAQAVELAGSGVLDLSAYRLSTHPPESIEEAIRLAGEVANGEVHIVTFT